MRTIKTIFTLSILGMFFTILPVQAIAKNKFEIEVEKEKGAIKIVREVQQGGALNESYIDMGAVKLVREVMRGEYDVITTKEFKKLIDSGKDILIIDTMPYKKSFKKAHIPGARNFLFPVSEMETWNTNKTDGKTKDDYAALLGPDKSKTIVVYCGFVKCARSHNGAMWAQKLGYKNVLRCPGGIYAWKGAGYKTESVK